MLEVLLRNNRRVLLPKPTVQDISRLIVNSVGHFIYLNKTPYLELLRNWARRIYVLK